MEKKLNELTLAMLAYEKGCNERINHFLKVHAFAQTIGQAEALSKELLLNLRAAALVHDIGIKASLEKLGHYNAGLQQTEGPPVAEKMLESLAFPAEVIARVSYLVAHHHTYTDIQGMDYQILIEADFLVNIFENQMKKEQVEAVRKNIFKTRTGLEILDSMYS